MFGRLILVAGATAYVAILTSVYVERVTPTWAYEGLRYNPPPDSVQPVTWLLALLPAMWIPMALERPSQVVYWFLYLVVYIPTCLLTIFILTIEPPSLIQFLCCMAACLLALGGIYRLPLLRLPKCTVSPVVFWSGLGLFGLMCYGIIISASGLRLALVSLDDVYGLRADYASAIGGFGPLLGYAVSWQVSLVNPLLVARGIARRSPGSFFAGTGAQVLMYSMTGFKLALFSGGIMFLILAGLAWRGRRFGISMLSAVMLIILLAVHVDEWTGGDLWTAILVNRSFVLPGVLTGYYFEFFSHNPQALLGDSVFRNFVQFPYNAGLPQVIGDAYVQGAWANANIWADAYANFGYVGLFAFTLLLAAVLHLFDSVAADHGLVLPALLAANAASVLVNGALLSSLLTNGIGLLIVLLYIMPRTAVVNLPAGVPGAHAGSTTWRVRYD